MSSAPAAARSRKPNNVSAARARWVAAAAIALTIAAAAQPAPRECFVLQALDGSPPVVSDPLECALRTVPASTFKLPHSLIALETGVIADPHALVTWDRSPQPFPAWQRDHSLDSAVKASVVWFFQRTAAAIGRARMEQSLKAIGYSADTFERDVTTFWLNGDLAVSPLEQVAFLRRLARYELPVQRRHVDAVQAAYLMPPGTIVNASGAHPFALAWPAPLVVRAKTGNATVDGERVSWLVGQIDSGTRQWVFASRVRATGELPGTAGAEAALRQLDARRPPPPGARDESASASGCEAMASLQIPDGAITAARLVDAGPIALLTSSDPGARPQTLTAPRAFCRVAARLTPTPRSDIRIEVWLPVEGWNRKFQAVGNGAFNGVISYAAMMTALGRGYAVASTDTGHVGGGASWALGQPEKVIDFGWRAVHVMTVAARQIVTAHYAAAPRFSYWNGCSAGGRQGLKAAQRFPDDFDGIIAGAPGFDWTGRAAQALRIATALEGRPEAQLAEPERQLLHDAVLRACDAQDGVTDGVLESPPGCRFDPEQLLCRDGDGVGCLTAAQVATAKMIYASPPNPKTGRAIPGLAPGSELGWTDLGWTASARATGLAQFTFLVFADTAWKPQTFCFDADIVRAEERDADTINALDPDLQPFIRRGGKLLQYHGWSDPQISPGSSVQYYTRVAAALGGAANIHHAYRLFMVPGMAHCGGGNGPNSFDMLGALERWVEEGKAPDAIVAARVTGGAAGRTRPLCPYPQVAAYTGSGSTDEASSFACRTP
jgi:feruloyl esterase